MLNSTAGDEREHLRWLWALRSADELLNSLGYLPGEKLALLLKLKESFDKEFDADKALKEQLKIRLRENKKNIEEIMDYNMSDAHTLYPLVKLLKERTYRLAPVVAELEAHRRQGRLQVPAANLAASYIHMSLNRVFVSRPRVHELVIYDFLYRYYQSLLARQKRGC
jgi:thiopeptide-type bacteriocin biosynthesis protein